MLNWIDINDRLPANGQKVYATDGTSAWWRTYRNDFDWFGPHVTHWIAFEEMPLPPKPKRWRTATIHDLAKAGKPIPCRAKNGGEWNAVLIAAISVDESDIWPFRSTDGARYKFCEVQDGD